MDKTQVLGIIGAAIGISAFDAFARRRSAEQLEAASKQNLDKYIRSSWREGFKSGFDDANRRLHYQIPRDEYPKFD